jgi:hypothetical protein
MQAKAIIHGSYIVYFHKWAFLLSKPCDSALLISVQIENAAANLLLMTPLVLRKIMLIPERAIHAKESAILITTKTGPWFSITMPPIDHRGKLTDCTVRPGKKIALRP